MNTDEGHLTNIEQQLKLSASDKNQLLALSDPEQELSESSAAHSWALLCWSAVSEPGDAIVGQVIAHHGAIASWLLWRSGRYDELLKSQIDKRELNAALKRWSARGNPEELVRRSMQIATATKSTIIAANHPKFPSSLNDLGLHSPLALWARGSRSLMAENHNTIALVGARAATSYGQNIAAELASDAANKNIPVISGAAYGIDAAAHRGALSETGTEVTVAVLAGGVDRYYPSGHTQLLQEIANRGVVFSEVFCGQAPSRWRFLQRNRLIAALARATIVVEAGSRSGSLNTAAHAASLGRPLGAVPGPITSPASVGSHRLLREFDAQCITGFADVLELIGFDLEHDKAEASFEPNAAQSRVRDALSARRALDVSEIAARSGLGVNEVISALGILRLFEQAINTQDGWKLRPQSER